MIEINLIPDVKRELLKAQSIKTKVIFGSVILGSVSVAVVAILAIYVFAFQNVRIINAEAKINSSMLELNKTEDLSKILTIQNQLTKISALNDSKKIESRIFDVLKAIIPPAPNDVKLSSLVIDSDAGTVKMEGQALNSYAAVEVFRKTIEGASIRYTDSAGEVHNKQLASNIDTISTSYGQNSDGNKVLRFNVSFVYAPELLSPSSSDVTVLIMVNGNATDSYMGVPTSIFVDPATDLTNGGGQ